MTALAARGTRVFAGLSPFLPVALLAAVPLLCSSTASAKDEVKFAQKLAEAGYDDLALEECKLIETSPSVSSDDKKALGWVMGTILQAKARKESDPQKREALIDEACQAIEKFIKDNKGHRDEQIARFAVGTMLQERGQVLAEAYRSESDPKKRQEIQTKADDIFKRATEYFDKMITKYVAAGKTPGEDHELRRAEYLFIASLYYHATLFPEESAERAAKLDKALKLIQQFKWDVMGGFLELYQVAIIEGLAFAEKKDFAKAKGAFNEVLDLVDQAIFAPDFALPAGVTQADLDAERNAVSDVMCRGYWQRAMMSNRNNDYADTLDVIKRFTGGYRDWHKTQVGAAAVLEMAKAYALMPDYASALESAQEVMGKVPSNWWVAAEAGRLVGEWGNKLANVGPDVRRKIVESGLKRGDFRSTLRDAQALYAQSRRDPKLKDYAEFALFNIGQVYKYQEAWYECAIVMDEFNRQFAGSKQAADAWWAVAVAYTNMFGLTHLKADDEASSAALQVVSSKYSASGYNPDFLLAMKAENAGDFVKAKDHYKKVKPSAPNYEEALARVGYMGYKHAKKLWEQKKEKETRAALEEAIKSLESYLEHVKEPTMDTRVLEARKNLGFASKECLVRCKLHPSMKGERCKEALALAQEMLKEAEAGKKSKVYPLIQSSQVGMGELEEAETTYTTAWGQVKTSDEMIGMAYELATALQDRLKNAKDPKPEELAALKERTATRYSDWVDLSLAKAKPVDTKFAYPIAEKCYEAGSAGNAGLQERALRIYRAVQDRKTRGELPADIDAKVKGFIVRWRIARLLALMKKFDEAQAVYDALVTENPAQVYFKVEMAEVGMGRARAANSKEAWMDVTTRLGELCKQIQDAKEPLYWQSRYLLTQALLEMGDYSTVESNLLSISANYGDAFDNLPPEFRSKFLELRKDLEKVKPGS